MSERCAADVIRGTGRNVYKSRCRKPAVQDGLCGTHLAAKARRAAKVAAAQERAARGMA